MSFYSASVSTTLSSQSIKSINHLDSVRKELDKSLQRLGTGYKFSSAADDPAATTEFSRISAEIYGLQAAIENNQVSFQELTVVDKAQESILKTLVDIRSYVQEALSTNSASTQQILTTEVSGAINGIDSYARGVTLANKYVLAGDGQFDLTDAENLVNTDNSYIRYARKDARLSMSFKGADAAEQATISGTLNIPTAPAPDSQFKITTDSGTATITIAADTLTEDALAQMNFELGKVGAHADLSDDLTKIFFSTDKYSSDATIAFTHVAGTNIVSAWDTATNDVGKTGKIVINGTEYDIAGSHTNEAPERAEIKEAYNTTGVAVNITANSATNGTLTYAHGGGAFDIDAMDAFFDAINVDVLVEDNEIVFRTRNAGNDEFFTVSQDVAGILFTGGDSFAASGRDYLSKDEMAVSLSTLEMTGKFIFNRENVTVDAVTGASPADDSMYFTLEGGVTFQLGDSGADYNSVRYGFSDLSADGLGLEQILDPNSSLYMFNGNTDAMDYIDTLISQVRGDWAEMGSFMKNFLDEQTDFLQGKLASLADQQQLIADVDEAYETAKITKLQILQQANISALSVSSSYDSAVMQLFAPAS